MIERFKEAFAKCIYYFLFNIKLNFSKKQDTFASMDSRQLFLTSFFSFLCIQLVVMVLANIFYVYGYELYQQQNLTYEALVQLKEISYTVYLLNQYPLNQLVIFLLVSLYLIALVISYKIANFMFGDSSLDWKVASVLGFTSFLPWQFTMFVMNLSFGYYFTNKLSEDHWFRQIFVTFNSYFLLISFLLSFYFVIRNAGFLTKLNLRKRILISMFPCIIFILIVGLLTVV